MWQKKDEFVDLRTGMHVITLTEPISAAEHKLQIEIGANSCPHCGHITPKTNLGDLDVAGHVAAEIASLRKAHADGQAYAAKHRVKARPAK